MANLAYRSVVGATNWSATSSWNVYSLSASGGVFPGGGTWGAASDYPKTGDYVWISSTASVTYDATAIATNNSATFAQISNNIASNGSAIAQPGTGGANASTGTISLSVASTTTINATYYNIAAGTAGLFNFTSSGTTYNFTGTWYEGTTGSWIVAPSGSNNTINITGNIKSSATSGVGISLTNVHTLNIIGDVTCRAGTTISCAGANTIVNITGNVYGSDTSTAYAIQNSNTTTTTTITGNLYSGVNAVAVYTPVTSTLTVTGNIRNYGSTGSSAYSAYICPQIFIRSTSTQQFRTSDAGVKDFTTTSVDPTLTAATIWSYATRTVTAATNITSDGNTISQTQLGRLDATVSSRAVAGDAMALTTSERTSVATSVWSSATRSLTTFGTLIADIWAYLTSSATTVGSIGKHISDNLDTTVSSRLATSGYTAPDNTTVSTINTNVSSLQVVTTQVNTNVGGAQTVIGTVNTNVSSLQSVTGTINTNVSSVQAVLGTVQGVTKSTQNVVDILNTNLSSTQQVVGTIQTATNRIPLNPASIETTGDQIAALQ